MASRKQKSAPTAAASVGVATPKKMVPMTMTMTDTSGTT